MYAFQVYVGLCLYTIKCWIYEPHSWKLLYLSVFCTCAFFVLEFCICICFLCLSSLLLVLFFHPVCGLVFWMCSTHPSSFHLPQQNLSWPEDFECKTKLACNAMHIVCMSSNLCAKASANAHGRLFICFNCFTSLHMWPVFEHLKLAQLLKLGQIKPIDCISLV